MAVLLSMPTADDRAASTPSSLSGRRLLSRITSPFGPKSRSVTDFSIDVADPHKQYSPGDTVHGTVKFAVVKPIRVTHLVVCLHGFAQVYKNPGAPPADGYRGHGSYLATAGRGKKSGEYFGNGFASLFEDELVLCGDGRLDERFYKFEFDLEFPDRDLPSSIDFERGTISYMITATLTRPIAIGPTMQCDRKVYLVERIDIAPLYAPKARTITLEPLARRNRAKHQTRKVVDPSSDRRSRKGELGQSNEKRRGSHASSSPSVPGDTDPPRSPTPSEISFESLGSASQQDSNATSGRQSDGAKAANGSKVSLSTKTITATVQSLTGGCLRGDSIPIKIQVHHTKHMKSLYGVIITLYRQARVDLHPAIPLGPTEKGKESRYEDYYPKSLTGLGGLSLSGAGSSHVFRKDLAQVMLPLMVDPRTLTADISGKIRVPDEAFPTISTVPGAMISFRYYVEVVLDIRGKLSSTDRNVGNLGGLTSTMNPVHGGVEGMGTEPAAFTNFGTPIIDTASIRRDKGVVACTFEVIVGTKDSARRKPKPMVEQANFAEVGEEAQPRSRRPSPPEHQSLYPSDAAGPEELRYDPSGMDAHAGEDGLDHSYGNGWDETPTYDPAYAPWGYSVAGYGHSELGSVPIPYVEPDSNLSEKARLERDAALFLPSEPPVDGNFSGNGGIFEATAPYLPGELPEPLPHHSEDRGVPIITATPAVQAGSSRSQHMADRYFDPDARSPGYELNHQSGLASDAVSDDRAQTQHRTVTFDLNPQAAPGAAVMTTTAAATTPGIATTTMATSAGAQAATAHAQEHRAQNEEHDELYTDFNDSHADASVSHGLPRYEQ